MTELGSLAILVDGDAEVLVVPSSGYSLGVKGLPLDDDLRRPIRSDLGDWAGFLPLDS